MLEYMENNVGARVANCFNAHESVILVFKHQNKIRVSEITYIILFLHAIANL